MIRLLTILFLLSGSVNAQVYFFGINANSFGSSSDALKLVGKNIEFYGNSITGGGNASIPANRWTTLFSKDKGAFENNHGIGGQVVESGSGCSATIFDKTTITTYNSTASGALFISFGVNDILYNNGTFTAAGYKAALLDVIDYAHTTRGWPYEKIVIVSPFYNNAAGLATLVGLCSITTAPDQARVDSYVTASEEAANEKGTIFIDVNGAMAAYPTPDDLLDDGVHPNDLGHAFIADLFASVSALSYPPGDNYLPGSTALTFSSSTNLTNTSGVITPTSPIADYGNTALFSSLSGDGYIAVKVPDVDGVSGIFGINTVNAEAGVGNIEAGVFMSGGHNEVWRVNNGSAAIISPTVYAEIGDWLVIRRTGSTIKLQKTPDGVSFTDLYTYSTSTSSTVYAVCDLYGIEGKIYYPQKVGF